MLRRMPDALPRRRRRARGAPLPRRRGGAGPRLLPPARPPDAGDARRLQSAQPAPGRTRRTVAFEPNGVSIGGIFYGGECARVIADVALDEQARRDVRYLADPCQAIPRVLRRHAAAIGLGPRLHVAILEDREWDAGITEMPRLAARLEAAGMTTASATRATSRCAAAASRCAAGRWTSSTATWRRATCATSRRRGSGSARCARPSAATSSSAASPATSTTRACGRCSRRGHPPRGAARAAATLPRGTSSGPACVRERRTEGPAGGRRRPGPVRAPGPGVARAQAQPRVRRRRGDAGAVPRRARLGPRPGAGPRRARRWVVQRSTRDR